MFNATSNADFADTATDVIVPLIRAAATIGFAIAPCSLGFVIIAVSEQLIRRILVGDDPEMLVSALQTQFPSTAIRVEENLDAALVAKVVDVVERSDRNLHLRLNVTGMNCEVRVCDVAWAGLTAAEPVP